MRVAVIGNADIKKGTLAKIERNITTIIDRSPIKLIAHCQQNFIGNTSRNGNHWGDEISLVMARQMRIDRRRHTFGNGPFQVVDNGGVGWQSQHRQFIDQPIKKAAKRIGGAGIGGGDFGFVAFSGDD
jgi:hypothetical protein